MKTNSHSASKAQARTAASLVVLILALLPAAGAQAAPAIVDPWTIAQCVGANCSAASPVVADPGILGGERDLLVAQVTGSGALRIYGAAWPVLAVENDASDGRSSYLVVWDGPDGDPQALDPTGLGGVDLLARCQPGSGHFALDQLFLDRTAAYTLAVYSDAGHWSAWSSGPVAESEAHFAIRPEDLVAQAGGGADLTGVGAISLLVDTTLEPTADLALGPLTWGCTPTAVELARFEAQASGDAVHLEWETASELDNLGFHLYRARSVQPGPANPTWTRLNAALIPAQAPGSPAGARYAWRDRPPRSGLVYFYWLEDVDLYGISTLHGPIRVEWQPVRRPIRVRPRPLPIPLQPRAGQVGRREP